MCLWVCTGPPGQMKNDTDLKFGRHTPLDHILKLRKSDPEFTKRRGIASTRDFCISIALFDIFFD